MWSLVALGRVSTGYVSNVSGIAVASKLRSSGNQNGNRSGIGRKRKPSDPSDSDSDSDSDSVKLPIPIAASLFDLHQERKPPYASDSDYVASRK